MATCRPGDRAVATQSQAVDFMANGVEPFKDVPVDVRAAMARCCFPRD